MDNPAICECGHHTHAHVGGSGKCKPWGRENACTCTEFKHVPDASPGIDRRIERR